MAANEAKAGKVAPAERRRDAGCADGPGFRDRAANPDDLWNPGRFGRGLAACFSGSRWSGSMIAPGTPPDEPAALETPPQVVASPRVRSVRSWFTLTTTREERFFLVLAVFIGVFSGLAVVCFRLAI